MAQEWWHKAIAETKRMGMRYDQGLIHLEMGQRLSEREHLRKAEVIFTEIGAEYDLTKVTALLHSWIEFTDVQCNKKELDIEDADYL